jgi:hypothetical protein
MSIALGNNKPEQLLEVEKLIWRALFTLSEGTTAPEHILGDLLLKIPWQNFPTTSPQDSEWFTIEATPVSAAPAQNILAALSTSLTSTLLPLPVPALSDNNPINSSTAHVNTSPSLTPLSTVSPLLDDNAMDQSFNNQPPPQSAELEKGAPSDNSPRQDPALPLSDNNTMDQSLDNQPLPPTPNVPASPLSDNNTMDQTLDNQPLTTTPNVPQAMEAEIATGIGFGAMNEDSPSDDPISGAGDGEEADSIEQSLEAPTSRRSARLALERSKEVSSPDAESSSRSTSPDEPFLPKSSQTTTAVKRKAPTGEPGGSRASPIDVDALHAVLERYPLRREPQVCRRRTLNRNFADELSSS